MPICYLVLSFFLAGPVAQAQAPSRLADPDPAIFSDGFESGDTSFWSSSVPGAAAKRLGALDVNNTAALDGNFGLEVTIDAVNVAYVEDATPNAETHYRASFKFDPNGVVLGPTENHLIFRGSDATRLFGLRLQKSGATYQVRAEVVDDGGGTSMTAYYDIVDDPNTLELNWRAATAPGANNRLVSLSIGGAIKETLSSVDNDTHALESVRLGLVDIANLTSAAAKSSGSEYFDTFASFRTLDPALPVELTSFDAVAAAQRVLLTWATASETNNAGFQIEGRHGEEATWKRLAFVAGQGTTTVPQQYSHHLENLAPGRHAFRLKQIDFDGAFGYSPVVEVTVEVPGTHVLTEAYPNPFNPQTTLVLTVRQTQQVAVAAYDALGRRVARLFAGRLEGGEPMRLAFEAGSLPSGVYLLRAEGEQFAAVRRVTLLK